MPTTEPYLLGRHLTAITIVLQLISAAGVMTNSTSYDLLAEVMGVDPSHEMEVDDIAPIWSIRMNEVPIREGDSIRIVCLEKSNAAQKLQVAVRTIGTRRYLISWVQGAEVFSAYYTYRRMSQFGITNRGQNLIACEFGPCDPGAAQMTYS